jgi:hypothetical protein
MRGNELDKHVKGIGRSVGRSVHVTFCGQAITGYIAACVVIVGLMEFYVQWIELLSGTLCCYALMSVNYVSALHQQ